MRRDVSNMQCCITELRNKDVINKTTGCRLGCVVDAQIDTCSGSVVALVVVGRQRSMGIFAREECFVRWEDIDVIGDDIILVSNMQVRQEMPKRRNEGGLFR